MTLKEFQYRSERNFILENLISNNWNKQKTAKILKIQRSHLYNLIGKYNLQESDQVGVGFLDLKNEYTPLMLSEPDFDKEKWTLLDGNKNYYISDYGRIKDRNEIFLSQSSRGGYSCVSIVLNGKRTSKGVHILVARSFIPNPLNKPQVNHINMIRSDNRVENLEWVTPSENINHSRQNGHLLAVKYTN